MKILILLVAFLTLLQAQASFLVSNPSIQPFLNETFQKLPEQIQTQLKSQYKDIRVNFQNLPRFEGRLMGNKVEVLKNRDSSYLQLPNCQNTVDSFIKSKIAQEVHKVVIGSIRDAQYVRHNGQVYGYLSKKKPKQSHVLVLHSGFLSEISSGPENSRAYDCEHKNGYQLAQGVILNLLVRLSNDSGLAVSSFPQYFTKAGWEFKENVKQQNGKVVSVVKNMQGFWPRAITPYEYAAGTATHYALNMEFFLLDSEYACRRPLLHDYLARQFGSSSQIFDPLSSERNCTVNYELKIPLKNNLSSNLEYYRNHSIEALETFTLDPQRVFNIHYLRAGASQGAGSFGHSMYRFVVCKPGQELSFECEKARNYDLVVNPRANPLELRLESLRALFGKRPYPSMFLVTPLDEIKEEYGVSELRHLYNIPFVGKRYTDVNGVQVNVMPDADKQRMIWATLDQYWAYYGMYWFISNNCADETLRLYKMATEDNRVLTLGKGITKPQDVNIDLHKLGLMDEQSTKGLEPVITIWGKVWSFITRKDMKWEDFEAQYVRNRQAFLENTKAELSRYYDILSAVRSIALLEGAKPKDVDSLRKVSKLAQKYVELAEPPVDTNRKGKIEELSDKEIAQIVAEIRKLKTRYNALLVQASDESKKSEIALQFFRLTLNIRNKRMEQISGNAIKLAYSIAETKDSKLEALGLNSEDKSKVTTAISEFSRLQVAGMPFQPSSVVSGYGIPLKNEVVRGQEFMDMLVKESDQMGAIIEVLAEVLAPDKAIDQELKALLQHIRPMLPARIGG